MAKIEKLPSGNYRIRVYDKSTGQRKSFTAPTKAEVKLLAAEWEAGHKTKTAPQNLTVCEAVKEYIQSKENILSPSSIRGYEVIYKNALGDFGQKRVRALTEKDLQLWVNENAARYKPKSIKSQFGLISAALRQCRLQLNFDSVLLPDIQPHEPRIPTEQEIAVILSIVEGTSVELPVTIAVTTGMRQSEIAALKWSDYDGEFLHVHAAKVPNRDNKYVVKDTTKSRAGTRSIEVDVVLKTRLDRAERVSEYISPMLPSSVLRKFQHLCDRHGLPHFTMHGQRHGNASLMLAQGVPDKYAMERLGQSSPNMIKNVYQHLYDDKKREVSKTISDKFSQILDTKLDTDTRKTRK